MRIPPLLCPTCAAVRRRLCDRSVSENAGVASPCRLGPRGSNGLFHSSIPSAVVLWYVRAMLRSSQNMIGLTGSDSSTVRSFFIAPPAIDDAHARRACKVVAEVEPRPMRGSARRAGIGMSGRRLSEK